jgi:hypothetical protein
MRTASATGPPSARHASRTLDRGSRKRLRRIKLRENTPISLIITALIVLAVMIITLAWLIQHPPAHHH